jgi:uncharacterized membrane protein (UPF0182 family)
VAPKEDTLELYADGEGTGEGALPPSPGWYEGMPGYGVVIVKLTLGLTAVLVLYFLLAFLRGAYTDWLWFSNLGLTSVFRTILLTRIVLWLMGLAASSAAIYYAYRFAWRTAWGPTVLPFTPLALLWIKRSILVGAEIMGVIVVLSFATALSNRWQEFLRFWNATDFGLADPQFGNDAGFYIFTLPMLHTLQGWLMGLAIVVLLTTAGVYLLIYSARGINPLFTTRSRTQLAIVSAALMITIAAAHFLDTYETLFSTSGAVTGATYADVTARIPALYLLTAVAVLAAAIMLLSIRVSNIRQSIRVVVAAFGLWAVAGILAGILWPLVVQRLAVDPSELQRERPYIERNIEWTRLGYDLDRITEQPYDVRDDTLARDIADNPETIANIRLWDPRPLESVYNQIQHLRLYYSFLDVDVDRYTIDGEYRQVLVGTRELFQAGLDESAQNWVNRKLVYTHGYGLVMATATDFTPAGAPNLVVRDVPTTGAFAIDEPRIFYGESFGLDAAQVVPAPPRAGAVSDDMIIVNTTEQQFDRPAEGASNLPIFLDTYDGAGGVNLSSFFRRIVYAWEFADPNLIFSSALTGDSKILYRRSIAARVGRVAPFLELDNDPYMVIADGKLFWIQDTFVTTDRLPYSRRIQAVASANTVFDRPLNYIRNSVKVVIDAFDGTMTFYTIEIGGPDPVLAMWRNTFPDLFTPIDQMAPSLKKHIRYPEELLEAQADTFLQYHMTDAQAFFLKEDQWELADEVVGTGTSRAVDPYYVIMKLPGEESVEFAQILPFTPQDKPNLVAWMAARSDGDHYGDISVYTFPKDRLFNGPSQIEARIDNDPVISEQFTLWDQSGSRVIRGNLLVIPIGQTLLYAEPIYLEADSLAFPELKRVILATGDRVVMEPTLDEAVRSLLGGRRPERPRDGEPVVGGVPPEELARVLEDVRRALESLQGGTEGLADSIRALEELTGETVQ